MADEEQVMPDEQPQQEEETAAETEAAAGEEQTGDEQVGDQPSVEETVEAADVPQEGMTSDTANGEQGETTETVELPAEQTGEEQQAEEAGQVDGQVEDQVEAPVDGAPAEEPVAAPAETLGEQEAPTQEQAPAEAPAEQEQAPAEAPVEQEQAPAEAPAEEVSQAPDPQAAQVAAEAEQSQVPATPETAPGDGQDTETVPKPATTERTQLTADDGSVSGINLVGFSPQEVMDGPVAPENTAVSPDKQAASPRMEVRDDVPQATTAQASTDMTPRGVTIERYQPPSPDVKEAFCTVKVMLLPSGQMHTTRCSLRQNLRELKQYFSAQLKIPPSVIVLMFNGAGMNDLATLASLGVGPNGTIQLEITSSDASQPIQMLPSKEYQMPDVITVRVPTETGELRDVVVEIERCAAKKVFLGGFRHKHTGAEFHHATAQTVKKQKPPSGVDKFTRDTQTFEMRHAFQQTFNSTSTQMTNIGVYVSNMEDKMFTPGKYTSSDAHEKEKLNKIIVIQKYYRRWLAERMVRRIQDDLAQRVEWERQEQERKQKEKEERIKREFERRMNPKTKEDFDLLYAALEKWRLEELGRIDESIDGAERKAALCSLLDQETQLLSAIDRHKNDAEKENKDKRTQQFLDKASAPKKWKGRDGNFTEMDTPYTIRAKELREIYNSINMKYLTQDERLDVLLTLKHTVREHYCKLTQEIIELVDREADLLIRGTKEGNLEGLRKRIATLFLQYIKTPTFNPEAARLIKVPQEPLSLMNNIHYCPCCGEYKKSTEFQLSTNSNTLGHCRQCEHIDNAARVRQDLSMYRDMLRELRRREEHMKDGSRIPYLLQERDIRYLVENLWSKQSVLSATSDLYDLVLIRWDRLQHWSPWNCILLTKEEASAHEKLVKLDEAYSKPLIEKVAQKHTLAQNYFSRVPKMMPLLQKATSSPAGPSGGPGISGMGLSATAVH